MIQPVASLRVPFPTAGGAGKGGGPPQYDAGSRPTLVPMRKEPDMKLREFPGALALGLLAALGAHTALYGGSHEMGGAFHGELVTVALAALGGLLVAFGALAWTGSRHTADGSVLAARLTGRLPGLGPVLVATALCFAAGERLEPEHAAAAFWPLVAAIVASAALLLLLARAAIKTLAQAVVRHNARPTRPAAVWLRRRPVLPSGCALAAPAFRRPPPQTNDPRA